MSVYCSLHAAAVARLGPAIGGFGTENSGQRSGRRFQRLRDRRGDRSGEERISRHGVRRAGNFQLTVPQGATLQVSFLGYESREISAMGKPLTVTLVEQTQQVDDCRRRLRRPEEGGVLGAISQVSAPTNWSIRERPTSRRPSPANFQASRAFRRAASPATTTCSSTCAAYRAGTARTPSCWLTASSAASRTSIRTRWPRSRC